MQRARLGDLGAARAGVDDGGGQRRSDRPELVGLLDQARQDRARVADLRRQGEIGIVGRDRDADLGVGRLHLALGRGDVGPALQQQRRHAGRNLRHLQRERLGIDLERRRRQADQHRDGVLELSAQHAGVDGLRLSALELGLGLGDVGASDHARGVLIAHDLQRQGIGLGRAVEQALELVLDAQLQVGGSERALRGQPRRGEIGGADLRAGDVTLDDAPDAAPHVDVPAGARRQAVEAPHVAAAPAAHPAAGVDAARGAIGRVARDGREQRGSRLLHHRDGVAIGRLGGLEGLIVDVDLAHQLIEQRVLVDRPPGTARRLVERLRDLPDALLLEFVRRRRRRAGIVGADHAAGEQQRGRPRDQRGGKRQTRHQAPSSNGPRCHWRRTQLPNRSM